MFPNFGIDFTFDRVILILLYQAMLLLTLNT